MWISSFPSTAYWKLFFSPLNGLSTLVKNYLSIYVRVYFWDCCFCVRHCKEIVPLRLLCLGKTFNGEGNGTPLQYSCLENPMDRGAWKAAVHEVARSWTWLSDFTFTFHFHALEKEMAAYSSVLAWRIPGTGEPGGLLSTGSHRVGHDWNDLAAKPSKKFLKV